MIDFEVKAAIFDVDDTLLDNEDHMGTGLHEASRLLAVHSVGKQFGIEALANYPPERNAVAFRRARVHSLAGALWYILGDVGLVSPEAELDLKHELLLAMEDHKNTSHDAVIRDKAQPIQDAPAFVQAFVDRGIKVAVASSALRRHIDIFFEKTGMADHFEPQRIKSYESITRPKPDPEVFELAFQSLGLPDSDRRFTCAFEDDPRGIESAHSAGLYVCAITSRYNRETLESLDNPPQLIGDSYQELAGHFGFTL